MSIDPTHPVAVEARDGLRIWIRFQGGEEGEIDLSHFAGMGVFNAWQDSQVLRICADQFL